MEGLFWLALIIGAIFGYQKLLVHGTRTRQVTTTLGRDQIRRIFATKVAVLGWRIVDDDEPMIAESTPWAGVQQQLALWVDDDESLRVATVGVVRYSKRVFGGLTKAHTLRMRMNSFVSGVKEADPSARLLEIAQ